MKKRTINPSFLPSPKAAFNRACEIEIAGFKWLSISGTASVGPEKETLFENDFERQVEQTYENIKGILSENGYMITDIIKWRVYLKDMTTYYDEFNRCRDRFFKDNGIDREGVGASVCVQATLCREELLVEIEAEAIKEK
jgi:enamine deaminase RidA (YjgF/YER057c/UK114 family)